MNIKTVLRIKFSWFLMRFFVLPSFFLLSRNEFFIGCFLQSYLTHKMYIQIILNTIPSDLHWLCSWLHITSQMQSNSDHILKKCQLHTIERLDQDHIKLLQTKLLIEAAFHKPGIEASIHTFDQVKTMFFQCCKWKDPMIFIVCMVQCYNNRSIIWQILELGSEIIEKTILLWLHLFNILRIEDLRQIQNNCRNP